VEVNESELAITKIEDHLEKLKQKQHYMMTQRGEDPDSLEELQEQTKLEGLRLGEEFIADKTRFNSKELIIEAYEGVLTHSRKAERDALNRTR